MSNISIPNSVTSIGDSAFQGCIFASNAIIGLGVITIGTWAFEDTGVHYINIPDNALSIGYGAFSDCGDLTNVIVGNSVTNVGNLAFAACGYYLKSVYFKGDLPTIGSSVFANDRNLTVYYLPRTAGWSNSLVFGSAVLWNPLAQTGDGSFGVQTNRFSFSITGTTNIPIVVEACTNLGGAWVPLQSVSLTNGSFYFSDPQWTNYPGRFYRLRSP